MFNIFTFLRENKIVLMLRAKLHELVIAKKEELKPMVAEYVANKSELAKVMVVTFIMEHITLGFPYNLFKGTIKKVLNKNFDRLVEFVQEKIQGI